MSYVASFGGFEKQYQIVVYPVKLQFNNLSLMDVMNKVKANNNDVGGRKFEMSDMAYIIRGLGYIKSKEDVENIALGNNNGIPVRVKDIGSLQISGCKDCFTIELPTRIFTGFIKIILQIFASPERIYNFTFIFTGYNQATHSQSTYTFCKLPSK